MKTLKRSSISCFKRCVKGKATQTPMITYEHILNEAVSRPQPQSISKDRINIYVEEELRAVIPFLQRKPNESINLEKKQLKSLFTSELCQFMLTLLITS